MIELDLRLKLPAWLGEYIEPGRRFASADEQIALAIELARHNIERDGGGPFGAAVFDAGGRVVAAGVNRVLPQACSLAHAEMLALLGAQQRLRRHRLNLGGERFTLATSAQPCCQCYGACIWAGIDELLIGARAEDVMELSEFDEGPLPADWIGELERRGIRVHRDLQRDQARALFVRYAEAGGERY